MTVRKLPRPQGADFRGARALGQDPPSGAAIYDAISEWGAYLAGAAGWEASRVLPWAYGLGFIDPAIYDGEAHPAEGQIQIDPTSFAGIRPALEQGQAWSKVLSDVLATNRWLLEWLTLRAWWPGQSQAAMQSHGFFGLLPGESVDDIDPPGNANFGTVYGFAHRPDHILAAVRELEADTRDELQTETEPAGVRYLRDVAADRGKPIELTDARTLYARSRGLSANEAEELRTPTNLGLRAMPISVQTIRATDKGLARSMLALRGAEPATIAQVSQSDTTTATVPTNTTKIIATYAGIGALAGGVLGRIVGGSWTGAAVGAGLGGVAGGGAAYAMKP